MPKQSNPGAPQGTEIVFVAEPFGGWVSTTVGQADNSKNHYSASIEGVEGGLAKEKTNQYAESDGVSLFRSEHFGHLAPGQVFAALVDSTPFLTDLAINGVVDSAGDMFAVLKNSRLVRAAGFLGAVTNAFDPALANTPGTNHSTHTLLSGANTTFNPDILVMKDLAGTPIEYKLWSWEDDTDADINILQAGQATALQNWYSALVIAGPLVIKQLMNGVPHKMCIGPDGNIYITNGSFVEQVVVNGALTAAVPGLELPIGTGWTATGIVSYRNYVAIICHRSSIFPTGSGSVARSDVAVYLWNGQSSTVNGVTSVAPQFIYPIPDNYGNGIFFDGSTLYAFTNGRNYSSKIFYLKSSGFVKLFETPLILPSLTPNQGSIENFQDSLMIGASKSNDNNSHLMRWFGGFHDDAVLTDGTNIASSVGMVKNLYTNYIYAGVKYGSTYKIFIGNNNLYQLNAVLRTILYTQGILGRRMYPLGFKGTVNRIQIFLSQWGTGASLTLSLFKDYAAAVVGGANDLLNLLIDTDTTTPNSQTHKAYPSGTTEIDVTDLAITDISSFYMIITFSHLTIGSTAAIIRSLVCHWSPSQ